MSSYSNANSGALFRNDDKREGKKDPDYRGQAEVGGVLYWLDAWLNTSQKTGQKFLSIRFKEKQAPKPAANSRPTPPEEKGFDDNIPFDIVEHGHFKNMLQVRIEKAFKAFLQASADARRKAWEVFVVYESGRCRQLPQAPRLLRAV
jgi:hypothetical protein